MNSENGTGSATASVTQTMVEHVPGSTQTSSGTSIGEQLVLHLRGRPGVRWTEETIDNEHLNKKSSKRCCIFHKVKKFAESDSDESDEEVEKAKKQQPAVPNHLRHHA